MLPFRIVGAELETPFSPPITPGGSLLGFAPSTPNGTNAGFGRPGWHLHILVSENNWLCHQAVTPQTTVAVHTMEPENMKSAMRASLKPGRRILFLSETFFSLSLSTDNLKGAWTHITDHTLFFSRWQRQVAVGIPERIAEWSFGPKWPETRCAVDRHEDVHIPDSRHWTSVQFVGSAEEQRDNELRETVAGPQIL